MMHRYKEIGWYFRSKLTGTPFFALYRMTRKCNLRCRMCSVWRQSDSSTELNLDQVRQVARILRKLKVPYIVLTGGDPFLRKDLPEIIKIFHSTGFHTRIETNGGEHATKELLDLAVESGLQDYSTSLDTLDPQKQDKLCQGKDVWQNAVDSLKYAMETFPGRLPHVNIVVSHHNLGELVDLVKFLDDLGAYCTLAPVVLGEKDSSNHFKGFDESFLFTQEDKQLAVQIYEKLIDLKKDGCKILDSTKFLRDSVRCIQTESMKWQCDAGKLYFEIFPDGETAICNEVKYGKNILEADFVRHFKSKKYREKRKELRGNCPGCAYPVFREPSYHFRYHGVLWEMVKRYLKETI